MAIYDFHCKEHGIQEIILSMKDACSVLPCPSCGKMMQRIFNVFEMTGQLPTRHKKMGETRSELFKNLAADGMADKTWKENEQLRNEQIITAREKIN